MPEAFHARFPVSVKSQKKNDPREEFFFSPPAEHVSQPSKRGTQGNCLGALVGNRKRVMTRVLTLPMESGMVF